LGSVVGPAGRNGPVKAVWETNDQIGVRTAADTDDGDLFVV
jgi:hypothetical protein